MNTITQIALRANHGKYVNALNAGGSRLVCNGPAINGWELMTLVSLGGNKVALRAPKGQYISAAALNQQATVTATQIGPAETFQVIARGYGKIALRATSGHYLSALSASSYAVISKATNPGVAETFDVFVVNLPQFITAVDMPITQVQTLQSQLQTQKQTYETTLTQQRQAHEDAIAGIKALSEQQTKAEILKAIEEAQAMSEKAQNESVFAQDQIRAIELSRKAALMLVEATDAIDAVQAEVSQTEQYAQAARQSAFQAGSSDPGSSAAIAAQSQAQIAQAAFEDAKAHAETMSKLSEQLESQARSAIEQLEALETSDKETDNAENSAAVPEEAEPIQHPLQTIEQELKKASSELSPDMDEAIQAAIAAKNRAAAAAAEAEEQASHAAQDYDNWAAIGELFGFVDNAPDLTLPSFPVENPTANGIFPDLDNWESLSNLFQVPGNKNLAPESTAIAQNNDLQGPEINGITTVSASL